MENGANEQPVSTAVPTPASRRRWFRFSLRTLLIFVLLIGSGIGLWWKWEPWATTMVLNLDKTASVEGFSISPDENTIAVLCQSGGAHRIEFYSRRDGARIPVTAQLSADCTRPADSVTHSPCGRWVSAVYYSRDSFPFTYLHRADSGKALFGDAEQPMWVRFSSEGTRFLVAYRNDEDRSIKEKLPEVRDGDTGRVVRVLEGPDVGVANFYSQLSPDGAFAFTGNELVDVNTGVRMQVSSDPKGTWGKFAPDSRHLVVEDSRDGQRCVRLFSLPNKEVRLDASGEICPPYFSRNGRFFLVENQPPENQPRNVTIYDLDSVPPTSHLLEGQVCGDPFSPDCSQVLTYPVRPASSGSPQSIGYAFWESATGQLLASEENVFAGGLCYVQRWLDKQVFIGGDWVYQVDKRQMQKLPADVLVTPSGHRLVTWKYHGHVAHVLDAADLRVLAELPCDGDMERMQLCRDDAQIVVWDQTPSFRVWSRRRPEYWWGVAWLPEFWLTVIFAVAFIWTVWRDRRDDRRGTTGAGPGGKG